MNSAKLEAYTRIILYIATNQTVKHGDGKIKFDYSESGICNRS